MDQQESWQITYHQIQTIITRCEKAQLKFKEGTSQYSLLRNRIKALEISNALVMKQMEPNRSEVLSCSHKEIQEALKPIISIINKCQQGQVKFQQDSPHYRRFQSLIDTMNIALSLLQKELFQDSDL